MTDTLLLDPLLVKECASRHDRERLQGSWSFVSGARRAQLLVAGDHFTLTFTSGDIYVGTFHLEPTCKPRAMDLVLEEAPERHRGKSVACIYEFDGDYLIWAPTEPGCGQRLPAFPSSSDLDHLCIVFRREKTPS
jgi:uncharacterized protein (TIGR03067 family)